TAHLPTLDQPRPRIVPILVAGTELASPAAVLWVEGRRPRLVKKIFLHVGDPGRRKGRASGREEIDVAALTFLQITPLQPPMGRDPRFHEDRSRHDRVTFPRDCDAFPRDCDAFPR